MDETDTGVVGESVWKQMNKEQTNRGIEEQGMMKGNTKQPITEQLNECRDMPGHVLKTYKMKNK